MGDGEPSAVSSATRLGAGVTGSRAGALAGEGLGMEEREFSRFSASTRTEPSLHSRF